jgi:ABC-type cobalamin/Fe3+-siderophores transport system ATPase subunit
LEPALEGRRRESYSGGAKAKHDAAAAERALARGMKAFQLDEAQLLELSKGAAEKVALAWWVRQRTTVPLRWVSQRLEMGHYSRVAQAVSRMRRRPGRRLEKLRSKLIEALDGEN